MELGCSGGRGLDPGECQRGPSLPAGCINYVVCCRTDSHASWVGNILDREACELIVKHQSPLYEQDLSSMIQKHFEDVLTQLEQQRNAEDKEPEGNAQE